MDRALVVCALLAASGACGTDDEPVFPRGYAASYVEVRNCRASGDHDLHKIRVLAEPAIAAIYQARSEPFPVGAVILKEEYDFSDDTCSDELAWWSVMKKTDAGWTFQRVAPDRSVTSENDSRCVGCHTTMCGVPPDGFDGTCAMP
jgi:hypothetical protein